MKKKFLLFALIAVMLFAFTACMSNESEENHDFVTHEAVTATCLTDGNALYYTCNHCEKIFDAEKNEITEIPTVSALGHDFSFVESISATCSTKGSVAHYKCGRCEKLFDLSKENEITSIESDYDFTNHSKTPAIVITANPTKLSYVAGETFDPAGMVVTLKCDDCEGEIIDNQFITVAYQTENADSFAVGDTKVTLSFNGMSLEVEVTVSKIQPEITGVLDSYTTSCGIAPQIEYVCNLPDLDVVIEYCDSENVLVSANDLAFGKEYTAKIFVEETDSVLGVEITTAVTVEHAHNWVNEDDVFVRKCRCKDRKAYSVINNTICYVDDSDMSLDFGALVSGAEDFQITSVKKVLSDGSSEEIIGEVDGNVYTYSLDAYEQTEYTPYDLDLLVGFTVEGVDLTVNYYAKYVEKVIRNAEDLKVLAYKGSDSNSVEGALAEDAIVGNYVLACDIDATGLVIDPPKHCWKANSGFCGIFNGNGHTVSNLTIGDWVNGLFGAVGQGGTICDVTFTNVTLGEGSSLFALALRNSVLTNVSVEFNQNSKSFTLADTANTCDYEKVTVKTYIEERPIKNVDEDANKPIPEGITCNYYPYATVNFDTDGAGEIASVIVSLGKTIPAPESPVKTSEDYDYEFIGWYYGDNIWSFATPVENTEMTLVARYNQTEKVNEEELIANVIATISVLPDSVTMPDHVYFVSRILDAKSAYDALPEDLKTQVTNIDKLNGLLANIDGYTTIFRQNVVGSTVIPSTVPNYTSTVGGTSAIRQDSLYGNVLTVTSNSDGKAALHYSNFPLVTNYEKVYFFVKVSVACDIYLADGVTNDGWGDNWKNTWSVSGFWCGENSWRMVEFNVSDGYAGTNFVIGFRSDASGFTFEISDIFVKELPPVPDTAIGLTFGNFVDSGTTNDYGKVYNFTQGWASDSDMGAFNPKALSGAVLAGHNALYFWIYNPNSSDVDFRFSGDMNEWNPTGDHVTTLTAGAWTKVIITPEIIAQGNSGTWFVGVSTGAGTSGWQISSLYSFAL